MDTALKPSALTALILVIALASCDDDGTTPGGPTDTTPPAVTNVAAVDANHIDVTFDENVRRETAERPENYVILEAAAPFRVGDETAAPGDTLRVGAASLGSNNRTVTLSTIDAMDAVNYDLSVTGVSDASGNAITSPVTTQFAGTTDADVTPPELVYRSPAPGATGVGTGQPVVFRFSEPVVYTSVQNGASWTVAGGGAPVPYELQTEGSIEFSLTPLDPLATNTQYTVTLDGVEDFAANTMPTTAWSFRTTNIVDTTPPTVVSTVPADNATYVNVNTNLSITFSEAVNQVTLTVDLRPDVGDGIALWSNGGRTVTFDPFAPLADNQQYTLTIPPGGMEDLAGNKNIDIVVVVFSTGAQIESGSFAGTILGDPGTAAADPTGAIVAAADAFIFETDDFNILGGDVVAANDTYDIGRLPDDVYYPISVMNTNGDDELDPSSGDAVGLYGIDFRTGDFSPDSVTIAGGSRVTGVNFPLFDISAITGSVTYSGAYAGGFYPIYIGVFETAGFDPTEPPAYGTTASWPFDTSFSFDTLDDGLADGTYYVGAFLDVTPNGQYDPASDPAGLYGGETPTVVNIQNGSDAVGLVIALEDPVAASSAAAGVTWPAPANRAPWLKKLSEAIREELRAGGGSAATAMRAKPAAPTR